MDLHSCASTYDKRKYNSLVALVSGGLIVAVPPLLLLLLYDQDVARYHILDLQKWVVFNFSLGTLTSAIALFLSSWVRVLSTAIVLTTAVLNVLYSISLYAQGRGFNHLFWSYFRLEIISAAHIYCALFVVSIFYFFLTGWFFFSQKRKAILKRSLRDGFLLVAFFSAIAVNPAVRDLAFYFSYSPRNFTASGEEIKLEEWLHRKEIQEQTRKEPQLQQINSLKPHLNVVWIYLESFERAYFEAPKTKDVVNELRTLKENSMEFVELTQDQRFEGGTTLGIFTSQCSMPYRYGNVSPNLSCFMSLLRKKGYHTAHIQGAVKEHNDVAARPAGYEKFMGRDELSPSLDRKYRNHGWGIYDEGLFTFAREYYKKVSRDGKPFGMTLLTVDNHTPATLASPGCKRSPSLKKLKPFIQAAACTSETVSDFIRFIRAQPNSANTIVVVMSDHLHPQHDFGLSHENRRLTFFINFPDGRKGKVKAPGTHFDIAPTVLEAMGFGPVEMGLGRSLLSHKEGFVIALERPATASDLKKEEYEPTPGISPLRLAVGDDKKLSYRV